MKQTLCWSCTRPGTNFCSWDRELIPVEGWIAEPTHTDVFESFHVLHCPEYQEEPPRECIMFPEDYGDNYQPALITNERMREFDQLGLSTEQIMELTGTTKEYIYHRRYIARKKAAEGK